MALLTRDGAVIPAHMSVSRSSDRMTIVSDLEFNNTALRVGYVVGVHYPGENGHANSKYAVYDVVCPQVDSTGAESNVTYYNCKMATAFGSGADWEKHTLRGPASYKGRLTPEFLKTTSKVLLLCSNGRKTNAYIIAAGSNAASSPDTKEEGHHWEWVFNGIDYLVDKEGQLSFTFNGKTVDDNGADVKPDPEVAGTFFKLDKDGSIILDDVKGERIVIDKKNKKITIEARSKEESIEGDWSVDVQGDARVQAHGNLIIDSDQKVFIGKSGASEPLVLGNQLVAALSQLVTILSSPVIGALGQAPVTTNPAVIAALKAWQAQYATPSAPILSKDKFTE